MPLHQLGIETKKLLFLPESTPGLCPGDLSFCEKEFTHGNVLSNVLITAGCFFFPINACFDNKAFTKYLVLLKKIYSFCDGKMYTNKLHILGTY